MASADNLDDLWREGLDALADVPRYSPEPRERMILRARRKRRRRRAEAIACVAAIVILTVAGVASGAGSVEPGHQGTDGGAELIARK